MAEEECPKCPSGAPAWVMTFADLMSLLMCFFVLLLSFATMDVIRFRQMAASLKNAFGVQTEIVAYETVKGTSVIAQHFSPATVEPTPLDEIRQSTTEDLPNLDIPESTEETKGEGEMDKEAMEKLLAEEKRKELEAEAARIRESLLDEIKAGKISVEMKEDRSIIRIHEKGSFPSGSAVLNSGFGPAMKKIIDVVKHSRGKVVVAGHTDNVPIRTEWYRSNWELSAARAVTVAHELLKGGVDSKRLMVVGYADTQPLVPNTSAANRARNRRVEIILEQEKH
ncbi:chemotaxis protein MotB [Methylomarinovum caldicuralii]|uniref:Chemotaxis protein MotB n=1 Tax=Methylomarinovum caldicuralii TaxID=438856 RepID=A0AAU9CEF8_9GAMM|nr:flagellar motor protein MotB [Methylomarinovum caldicuralii]BCX82999.1 chemotaxis protein MotB [Methylomarinovum caldicuralii]